MTKMGKAGKARLLRVSSNLLIAYGVLAIILACIMLVSFEGLGAFSESSIFSENGEDLSSLLAFAVLAAVLSLAQGVLSLIAGVMGHRVLKGKARAETCQTLGIVLVGVAFVSMLFSALVSGFSLSGTVTFVASSALPVLFYLGARSQVRNRFWEGVREGASGAADADDSAGLCETTCRYRLGTRLEECPTDESPDVEIVTLDRFKAAHPDVFDRLSSTRASDRFIVSATERDVAISLVLPNVSATSESTASCYILLGTSVLVAATDDSCVADLFDEFARSIVLEEPSLAGVLIGFLKYAIKDDVAYLYEQERRLDRLEDNMAGDINEIPEDFDLFVNQKRRLLRKLHGLYRQYGDLAITLSELRCTPLAGIGEERYRALEKNARRLADDAGELGEYIMRIKDFYQSKIDVRQNKVMQTLTIVTSVFMPLTLITGWYGMNFEVMPELHWKASYFVVMAIAVSLVTVEIVLFKRKKWF